MSGHRALSDNYLGDTTVEDPGAGGTIQVHRSPAVVDIVTADAEARTLADPLAAGVFLVLTLKTDGGDCTVTASTGINQAGNTVCVFADAGDILALVSVPDPSSSGDFVWRVIENDGGSLS
jgi:hypothetical protein